jgi:hypothetical protein
LIAFIEVDGILLNIISEWTQFFLLKCWIKSSFTRWISRPFLSILFKNLAENTIITDRNTTGRKLRIRFRISLRLLNSFR